MRRLFQFTCLAVLVVTMSCSEDHYWGASQHGLRVHIDVETEPGNGHSVKVYFQNCGKKQIEIWESGFWPNTLLQCFYESGEPVEATPQGRALLQAFSPGGERSKNYRVTLDPQQTYRADATVYLEQVYNLKPGTIYKVRVLYQERCEKGWAGMVTSNTVRIGT